METFIQTQSGIRVPLLDPKPEHILIEDIGWALAHQCRFGGHCKQFYSVAEHSIFVSDLASGYKEGLENVRLEGLLHDAAEAYIIDIPSPLKSLLKDYKIIERKFEAVIRQAFSMGEQGPGMKRLIKDADRMALATEARDLMIDTNDWDILRGVKPHDLQIFRPCSISEAYTLFIARFMELKEKKLEQV